MMLKIPFNLTQRCNAIDTAGNRAIHSPLKQFTREQPIAIDGRRIVNLRNYSAISAIPAPPISVGEYIHLNCPSSRLTAYMNELGITMLNTSLDKYQRMRTPENFLGKGSFKVCHDIGGGKVLVVGNCAHELMRLAMLERAGVPVAKVHEIGSIKKDGFREQAYVQQKLENFYVFGQNQPDTMHSDFLESPLLNEKTISSLKAIRSFTQKYDVPDLQGGLGSDGGFLLTDVFEVMKAESKPTPFASKQARTLDNLIRSSEIELQRRQRSQMKKVA